MKLSEKSGFRVSFLVLKTNATLLFFQTGLHSSHRRSVQLVSIRHHVRRKVGDYPANSVQPSSYLSPLLSYSLFRLSALVFPRMIDVSPMRTNTFSIFNAHIGHENTRWEERVVSLLWRRLLSHFIPPLTHPLNVLLSSMRIC